MAGVGPGHHCGVAGGRLQCPDHGVVVAHVPWARHGAGHTHAFDEQVAWLATKCSKSAACELMRIAWRTVGSIITRVWADGADWISDVVAERCGNAVRCADPFHIVKWATEALDEVRRDAWNTARGAVGRRKASRSRGTAKLLKDSRYALWKNPSNLTEKQQAKLDWIVKTDPGLHRAYLLKEGLRLIFQLPYEEAVAALSRWIGWARRCRIPAFVTLQRRIVRHRDSILAAIEHGLSNGRIESVNTKVRLITRMAFGFATPDALIALAMLNLGGHRPELPGRS